MKKTIKNILVIALALVMSFGSAANIFASANSVTYISDISIGYGDSGKQRLKDAGYTVWENLNANDGGRGDAVWIGYMETDDATEAITDIALMNMKGGYSMSEWQNEVARIKKDVENLLSSLGKSVEEFQTRFDEGSIYAQYAYEFLNYIEETESGMLLGDFLLEAENPTQNEELNNAFMLANSTLLSLTEQMIAYACTDYNDEGSTFLTRLEEYKYTGKLNFENNLTRQTLMDAVEAFALRLDAAENSIASVQQGYADYVAAGTEPVYANIDEYVNAMDGDDKLEYYKNIKLIDILKNTAYADTGHSLYDFVKLDKTDKDLTDPFHYSDEIYEPLANCMTKGQIGALRAASIEDLIINADGAYGDYAFTVAAAMEAKTSEMLNAVGTQTISFYYNVDTSLYKDADTVALTSDAIREKAKNAGGYDAAEKVDDSSEEDDKTLVIIAAATAGLSLVCGALWAFLPEVVTELEIEETVMVAVPDIFGAYTEEATTEIVTTTLAERSCIAKICGYVAIIAIVVAIITIVVFLVSLLTKEIAPENIKYAEIPRAIVDLHVDGDSRQYINYYAAKNIEAASGETASTKLYGDLNAINNIDQWFVLYYTKDDSVGAPLTTDMVVSSSADVKEGYCAFHEFGSALAVDLNKYNSGINCKNVYAYVKQAAEEAPTTGSVFSTSVVAITGVGGIGIGAVLSGLIFGRKKKEQTA